MKATSHFLCAIVVMASVCTVAAQDAAAPIRRLSPTPTPAPAEASTPASTPEREDPPARATSTAEPEPTPARPEPTPVQPEAPAATPEAQRPETPASAPQADQPPAATPAPSGAAAAETTPKEQSSTRGRGVRTEEPVRAVDPRPAWTRGPRPPAGQPPTTSDRRGSDEQQPEVRDRRRSTRQPAEVRGRRPWDEQPAATGATRPTFDLSTIGSGSVSGTIRRLERRWQQAIREHDVATIDELLADDFVGVSSTGRTGSKSTLLGELRRDKNKYDRAEARGMSVRTDGDDVAVVTGTAIESGTTPEGKRFRTSRRFTDTWVKRNGRWRCIASHTTQLPAR